MPDPGDTKAGDHGQGTSSSSGLGGGSIKGSGSGARDIGVAGVPGGVNRTGGSLAPAGKPSTGAGKQDLGIAGVPGGVNRLGGSLAKPAGTMTGAGKQDFGGLGGPSGLRSPLSAPGRTAASVGQVVASGKTSAPPGSAGPAYARGNTGAYPSQGSGAARSAVADAAAVSGALGSPPPSQGRSKLADQYSQYQQPPNNPAISRDYSGYRDGVYGMFADPNQPSFFGAGSSPGIDVGGASPTSPDQGKASNVDPNRQTSTISEGAMTGPGWTFGDPISPNKDADNLAAALDPYMSGSIALQNALQPTKISPKDFKKQGFQTAYINNGITNTYDNLSGTPGFGKPSSSYGGYSFDPVSQQQAIDAGLSGSTKIAALYGGQTSGPPPSHSPPVPMSDENVISIENVPPASPAPPHVTKQAPSLGHTYDPVMGGPDDLGDVQMPKTPLGWTVGKKIAGALTGGLGSTYMDGLERLGNYRWSKMDPSERRTQIDRWAAENKSYLSGGDIGQGHGPRQNPYPQISFAHLPSSALATAGGGGTTTPGNTTPDPWAPPKRVGNPVDPYSYGYGPGYSYFNYG